MNVHVDEIREQLQDLYYTRANERDDDHEMKLQNKLDELRSIASQEYLENINGQLEAWELASQDIVRVENERIRKERERLERLENSGDRINITNKLNAMTRTPIQNRESDYKEKYDELIKELKNYLTEENWIEFKNRYDRKEGRNKQFYDEWLQQEQEKKEKEEDLRSILQQLKIITSLAIRDRLPNGKVTYDRLMTRLKEHDSDDQ